MKKRLLMVTFVVTVVLLGWTIHSDRKAVESAQAGLMSRILITEQFHNGLVDRVRALELKVNHLEP
jgi:hypothetical protein